MLVKKEVARPGTYWYVNEKTGQPAAATFTPAHVAHYHAAGNAMLAAGLSIPVPLEHQPDAKPLSKADRAAHQLRHNTGWVDRYEMENGVLYSVLDIQDAEIAKKLPKTIKWTSPYISSFTDGAGKKWDNVITHVALTSRPRIAKQAPFTDLAAALSLTTSTGVPPGVALSRAGLLDLDDSFHFKPKYPMAFSLWSGVKLALEDMEEREEKDEEEHEGKDGDGEGRPPAKKEKSEGPPDKKPSGDKPPASDYDQHALEDGEDDISIYDVLTDLLETVGIPMMPGTEDDFCNRLYEAVMTKLKGESPEAMPGMGGEEPMPNTPPPAPAAPPPSPIKEEQPPLYMSLEEARKIADPGTRRIAESAAAAFARAERAEKRELAAAKVRRDQRIERVARFMSQSGRDQITKMAAQPAMALSIGDDGSALDPLSSTLDLLESQQKEMPALLVQHADPSVQPQPTSTPDNGMTEERRQAVVAEQLKAAGIK